VSPTLFPEHPCAIINAGRKGIIVLADFCPRLRAHGRLTRSDLELIGATIRPVLAATIAFLGPGDAVNDLTFHAWPLSHANAGPPDYLAEAAAACAAAARVFGRVLPEPVLRVTSVQIGTAFELFPPRRWWFGDWLVRTLPAAEDTGNGPLDEATKRVPIQLILHGDVLLP
jgi:hypothetical protein